MRVARTSNYGEEDLTFRAETPEEEGHLAQCYQRMIQEGTTHVPARLLELLEEKGYRLSLVEPEEEKCPEPKNESKS
jgi:hypothetical protein